MRELFAYKGSNHDNSRINCNFYKKISRIGRVKVYTNK